jgi:hypothetical protein
MVNLARDRLNGKPRIIIQADFSKLDYLGA